MDLIFVVGEGMPLHIPAAVSPSHGLESILEPWTEETTRAHLPHGTMHMATDSSDEVSILPDGEG